MHFFPWFMSFQTQEMENYSSLSRTCGIPVLSLSAAAPVAGRRNVDNTCDQSSDDFFCLPGISCKTHYMFRSTWSVCHYPLSSYLTRYQGSDQLPTQLRYSPECPKLTTTNQMTWQKKSEKPRKGRETSVCCLYQQLTSYWAGRSGVDGSVWGETEGYL